MVIEVLWGCADFADIAPLSEIDLRYLHLPIKVCTCIKTGFLNSKGKICEIRGNLYASRK